MTIAEALRDAAQYVERNLSSIAWDRGTVHSDEDKVRITAEVSDLGYEVDALAAANQTAPVYYREYEAIKGELQRRGFFLDPEIARAVADAFHADGVAKPSSGKGGGPGVRPRKVGASLANPFSTDESEPS